LIVKYISANHEKNNPGPVSLSIIVITISYYMVARYPPQGKSIGLRLYSMSMNLPKKGPRRPQIIAFSFTDNIPVTP